MMGMYNTGDKVKFKNAAAHEQFPGIYPAAGTVGTVVGIAHAEPGGGKGGTVDVQWPAGSTSYNDLWCAAVCDLEPA